MATRDAAEALWDNAKNMANKPKDQADRAYKIVKDAATEFVGRSRANGTSPLKPENRPGVSKDMGETDGTQDPKSVEYGGHRGSSTGQANNFDFFKK